MELLGGAEELPELDEEAVEGLDAGVMLLVGAAKAPVEELPVEEPVLVEVGVEVVDVFAVVELGGGVLPLFIASVVAAATLMGAVVKVGLTGEAAVA